MNAAKRVPETPSPWQEWRDSGLCRAQWQLVADRPRLDTSLRITAQHDPEADPGLTLYPSGKGQLAGALTCSEDQLPFEDASWARIVVQHALEHPDLSRALLAECVRVLSPAGELIVFGFDPLSPAVLGKWLWRRRWRREYRPVPPQRLAHVLGMAGLARIQLSRYGDRTRALGASLTQPAGRGLLRPVYRLDARKLESNLVSWRGAAVRVRAPAAALSSGMTINRPAQAA